MTNEGNDYFSGLASLLNEFGSVSSSNLDPPSTEVHLPATGTATAEGQPHESGTARSGVTHSHGQLMSTASRQLPFLLSQESYSLESAFAHCQEACQDPRSEGDCHSDLQLPPEHLQCAGQTLPCLATELMAAQSSQVGELERKRDKLQQLQIELAVEKERLSSIEKELCSATTAMCLSQDDCASLTHECILLEKTIADLVTEKLKMELKLKRVREEDERSGKMFEVYRDKVSRHEARTREVESTQPLYKEMEGLESTIQSLKDQRCECLQGEGLQVLSGEKHKTLQEEVDVMMATLTEVREESKEKRKKVEACREHNQQLKKEIEMKRKRHTAQRTRLQRQVSEAQSRKRQWTKEAGRLQANVMRLKLKLEE